MPFGGHVIQAQPTSPDTPQGGLRRWPEIPSVRQEHGVLLLLIIATVLLTMVWTASWQKRPRIILAVPEAHAIAELAALPGSPKNVLSARLRGIGYDEARSLNAAIPFVAATGGPARGFPLVASLTDRTRATDCLAVAAMAEAGDSDDGQRAVIQVVLNRVVHPAFAKTICGVVFEGSQRTTGCQFSFTCDGALARRYSAAAWARARTRANEALDGRVYAPVGLATHYHTDWVHPYWSDSLAKIARVDTHLFFRWPGYWGSAAVLSVPYRAGEPAIAQLAYLPAHSAAAGMLAAQGVDQATDGPALRDVVVRNGDGGAFVLLAAGPSTSAARDMGRGICMDRPSCKVFGWFDRAAIPPGYPVPASARAQLGFSYFRDAHNNEIVLYNCARFANIAADACIPATMARVALGAGPAPVPAPAPLAMTSLRAVPGKDGLATPIGQELRPLAPLKESL